MEASGVTPPEQPQTPAQPDPAAPAAEPTEADRLRAQIAEQQQQIEALAAEAQAGAAAGGTTEDGKDVRDLLHQLVDAQSQQRQEVLALRQELAKARQAPLPATTTRALSPEELLAQRMNEINAHPFYCPACGRTYDYQRECIGRGEAPHPPVDVVSTDELKNPPDSSDKAAVAEYQSRHTAMQYVDPHDNTVLLSA